MLKELVEFVAKSLVDYPEKVKVTEIEGRKLLLLSLW